MLEIANVINHSHSYEWMDYRMGLPGTGRGAQEVRWPYEVISFSSERTLLNETK